MTITLTKADVMKGEPADECFCMFARAIRRKTKAHGVRVRHSAFVDVEGVPHVLKARRTASSLISQFDKFGVKPKKARTEFANKVAGRKFTLVKVEG